VESARVGAAVKPVGKLDVRNGHVQFDERGRETIGGLCGPGQAPFLDSTDAARCMHAKMRAESIPGSNRTVRTDDSYTTSTFSTFSLTH
jgi:hypothetical protein